MADINNNPTETTNATGNQTDVKETEKATTTGSQTEPKATEPTVDELAELAKLRAENAKLKNANNKLSSENGNLNKSLREKLSAEELEAEEKAKQESEREAYVKSLERERDLNIAIKRYMTMGMPEEMATETANFELDNDMDSVSKNVRKNQDRIVEERVKKERDEWDARQPQPNIGIYGECSVTKEQFDKMGYSDRAKFYRENPEKYQEYNRK